MEKSRFGYTNPKPIVCDRKSSLSLFLSLSLSLSFSLSLSLFLSFSLSLFLSLSLSLPLCPFICYFLDIPFLVLYRKRGKEIKRKRERERDEVILLAVLLLSLFFSLSNF